MQPAGCLDDIFSCITLRTPVLEYRVRASPSAMEPLMTRLLALGSFLFLCAPVAADDWPQWLGPQRDGIWRRATSRPNRDRAPFRSVTNTARILLFFRSAPLPNRPVIQSVDYQQGRIDRGHANNARVQSRADRPRIEYAAGYPGRCTKRYGMELRRTEAFHAKEVVRSKESTIQSLLRKSREAHAAEVAPSRFVVLQRASAHSRHRSVRLQRLGAAGSDTASSACQPGAHRPRRRPSRPRKRCRSSVIAIEDDQASN